MAPKNHHYTTCGAVRGSCGHRHRSIDTADRCLRRDRQGCRAQGGYSDRHVVRKSNPSTAVWLLLAGVGVGATWLLLRKKEEKKPTATRPAPQPPNGRTAPPPTTKTPPPPAKPAGKWLAWDGCMRPGWKYRIGSLQTMPAPAELAAITATLAQVGLTSIKPPYEEGGALYLEVQYAGPENCPGAMAPPIPPGYTIQQWTATLELAPSGDVPMQTIPLQGVRLPVLW